MSRARPLLVAACGGALAACGGDGELVVPCGGPACEPDAGARGATAGDDGGLDTRPGAAPLEVCATGAEYTTIAAAIADAPSPGVIEICPGTYRERLVIGKALRLVGRGAPRETVIDAERLGVAVRVSSAPGPGVALEGVTLRGGRGSGGGGGVRCQDSDLRLQDVVIAGNEAAEGGGVYAQGCAVTARNATIARNASVHDGAGVYLEHSDALFEDGAIVDNHAGGDGGGMRLVDSAAVVRDSVIAANVADHAGGGIRVSLAPGTFLDNTITDNEAQTSGGGIDMDRGASVVRGGTIARNTAGAGGGVHAWMVSEDGARIEDVAFEDNWAWRGGAINLRHNDRPIALRHLAMRGNEAGYGGGLFVRTSHVSLSHSTFEGNRASVEGGGLHIGGDGAPFGAGECPPCPPAHAGGSIDFIVAYDNHAEEGGSAMWLRSPQLSVRSSIVVANPGEAVVVDLTPGGEDGPSPAPPSWEYNDAYPASFTGVPDPTGTAGNLSTDPRFVDAPNGNFELDTDSACIDAGDPAFVDTDNTRADMGVFGGLGGTP